MATVQKRLVANIPLPSVFSPRFSADYAKFNVKFSTNYNISIVTLLISTITINFSSIPLLFSHPAPSFNPLSPYKCHDIILPTMYL